MVKHVQHAVEHITTYALTVKELEQPLIALNAEELLSVKLVAVLEYKNKTR